MQSLSLQFGLLGVKFWQILAIKAGPIVIRRSLEIGLYSLKFTAVNEVGLIGGGDRIWIVYLKFSAVCEVGLIGGGG